MYESADSGEAGGGAGTGRALPGARGGPWPGYLVSLAATFAVLLAGYSAALAGLHYAGRLPPPPITNEVCADEKLRWLREQPPENPNALLVGSSIAFRNVDTGQLARRDSSVRPLNGGVCHMQVNQTAFVTGYLLRHFPSVRTVTALLAPQDLTSCAKTPAQVFDPETADAYVFEHRRSYRYYLSHFDPVSLARNAALIRDMREGRIPLDPLIITRYGDGPLDTEVSRGLSYGKLQGFDPACFAALRDLAETVAAGGRRFLVATSPVHPDWSAHYDAGGRLHGDMVAGIRAALHGTGAEFWDGGEHFAGTPAEFTDAIHIRWSAAHRYGALLAAALDAEQERP